MACTGSAPNWTAPTWADVQDCHDNHVVDSNINQTITVSSPGPGPLNFTTTINKNVTVQAAAGVTLQDATGQHQDFITMGESTLGSNGIVGFLFDMQLSFHASENALIRVFSGGVSANPVRILNNTFINVGANGQQTLTINFNVIRGVVAGNAIYGVVGSGTNCFNNASFVRMSCDTCDLTVPSVYGNADDGTHAIYVENNYARDIVQPLIDVDTGGRLVARFNTFQSAAAITHHGDSSPGGRTSEIYKNIWSVDRTTRVGVYPPNTVANACIDGQGNTSFTKMSGWVAHRAGTTRILDNTIPVMDLTPAFSGCPPGSCPIDSITLNLWEIRRNVGQWACFVGEPNTNPIGTVQYPAPYQIGWVRTTTGTPSGGASYFRGDPSQPGVINMTLEPTYAAGNTGGGGYDAIVLSDENCNDTFACDNPNANPNTNCLARASVTSYVHENREFYQQKSNFNGTVGTGFGPRTGVGGRPATCTSGTGWWSTDQGSWNLSSRLRGTGLAAGSAFPNAGNTLQGVLDICVNNAWVDNAYVPFTYPHPLAGGTPPPTGPTLNSISPNSAQAGSAGFTITANGSGFVSGATVKWNASARTTVFVNSTQLTASVLASDIVTAGTANVTVVNPDTTASGPLVFTITPPPPGPTIGSTSHGVMRIRRRRW
jgi:hypothetical protein